ncbi:hypothetical protein [Streptomyces triculaminicus]|uniref:hypothetical protein n=1 Tax=Streptomyces triculaminicus TaxID=2816232 RepID=UPI0037B1D29E
MTRHNEAAVRESRSLEANLWGSALVFSSLSLVSRGPAVQSLAERFEHVTVVLYLLGWIGPAAALVLCAVRAKRPWNGAIVPVAVHAVLGLLYWLVLGWT